MASTPQFKIYTPSKEYVAACKYAEDAAALVALYGEGAVVRFEHSMIVWTEGREKQPAGESYDYAASLMNARVDDKRQRTLLRLREGRS